MMRRARVIATSAAVPLLLSSCASVPRGPAATLADAGLKATGTFASDVRETATRLEYAEVTEAFTGTWQLCQSSSVTCQTDIPSGPNADLRNELANLVRLRANALDELGRAYAALKQEADYDARADLTGATRDALTAVNGFAAAVYAASGPAAPGAALIAKPAEAALVFGAGIFAEQRQRRRLLHASRVIRAATRHLRNALAVEAHVFDLFADAYQMQRAAARIALLEAGLISSSDLLSPMASQLEVKLLPTADATLAKSDAAKTAVSATIQTMSKAETRRIQRRYRLSVDALDALLASHDDFEKERPVSLADVNRFLIELDAGLREALEKEEPAA